MPREIKFRAWFGEYLGMDYNVIEQLDIAEILEDKIPLMQYTGLKDKNGKEIYEGDLLQGIDKLYQVTWNDEKAGYYITVIKTDYTLSRGLSFPMHHWAVEGTLSDCEVIGNIYENPELLEG